MGQLLVIGVAYYLLARLGVALGVPPDGIAVFWPPNAIILCTFLILPTGRWWACALAFVCAEVIGDIPVFTVYEALGFGIVNCFEGILSALILRRAFDGGFDLSSSRQLLYFVVVCVVGAPALAALAGSAIYVLRGSEESYLILWRTWWAGDAVGLLTFAPLILTLWRAFQPGHSDRQGAYWLELALTLGVLAGVTAAVFMLDWFIATDYDRLFYVYPVLVWIALRGGVLGAAAASAVIALVVSWMALSGEIPVDIFGRFADVLFLQQLLAVTILSTLTLAVLVQERAALSRKLGTEIERTRSQKAILEAKERAERANEAKTTFLAHMSHELRTPLNAIIGFSSSMRKEIFGPVTNERYREYAGDIEESAQHLLSLINDLIDISRIEGGALALSETSLSPSAAIDDALRMLRSAASSRNIRLQNSTPPDMPNLLCDEVRLRQVLINIVSNAIKFSLDSGRIDVSARCEGGRLLFIVQDEGIGIPKEELESAFQRYQQFSSDPHLRAQGSGLGLYVSRMLMAAHGGEIAIESAPDKGTTVTLVFPPERVVPR